MDRTIDIRKVLFVCFIGIVIYFIAKNSKEDEKIIKEDITTTTSVTQITEITTAEDTETKMVVQTLTLPITSATLPTTSETVTVTEVTVTEAVTDDKGEEIPITDEVTYINELPYIDGILMVNKSYSLPADYDPGVDPEAERAFTQMQLDAKTEGLNIYISSSYRSYNYQVGTYNRYVQNDGVEMADTYSARPGFSEHQTGLCFDLNTIDDSFGATPESAWVSANCYKYGFIIRFPEGKEEFTGYKYEPWHIRYVGIDRATKIWQSGLSMEEYYGVQSVYAN
jgi:D-alanyl-D-alanine carboxypeptidase